MAGKTYFEAQLSATDLDRGKSYFSKIFLTYNTDITVCFIILKAEIHSRYTRFTKVNVRWRYTQLLSSKKRPVSCVSQPEIRHFPSEDITSTRLRGSFEISIYRNLRTDLVGWEKQFETKFGDVALTCRSPEPQTRLLWHTLSRRRTTML